ncbi:PP2C family protein-serine/threonine phosphatase [Amycolatopsis sp. NPDC059657]|uniref:PP2C family protein-serine/threonine phosphatase n=1 Tax=Amycolatopsis sp. NPDC059657 TaxID=3346899 RepID=UPI00366FA9A7
MTRLGLTMATDVGLRRQVNEDSAYLTPQVQAIADGMGGHGHGDLASAIAIDVVREFSGTDLGFVVAEIARRLDEQAPFGCGTTLTAMRWDENRFQLGHIGDSRGYLLRSGELRQLTRDHTMVQALVDEGRMSAEEAAEHPRRNMLMRALQSGTEPHRPDLAWHDALPGDRYLLCSDGLTDYVEIEAIHNALYSDRETAAAELVALANGAGGFDNVTCLLIDVPCR